jgi:hypothetical protein
LVTTGSACRLNLIAELAFDGDPFPTEIFVELVLFFLNNGALACFLLYNSAGVTSFCTLTFGSLSECPPKDFLSYDDLFLFKMPLLGDTTTSVFLPYFIKLGFSFL